MELSLIGEDRNGTRDIRAELGAVVIAGWTGRDAEAVEAHIRELERIGVKRPKSTPIFYRVSAALLTTAGAIQVAGQDTSGEVEPVLVSLADGLWVGVGSDHTDRKLEVVGVTIAKQLCAKPLAPRLWPFAEVAAHWDRLILRSYGVQGGERRLYQEGDVAGLRDPRELMRLYLGREATLPAGMAMFGGTLAAHGGIASAERFEIELEDPVLRRCIAHAYDIVTLPVEG